MVNSSPRARQVVMRRYLLDRLVEGNVSVDWLRDMSKRCSSWTPVLRYDGS